MNSKLVFIHRLLFSILSLSMAFVTLMPIFFTNNFPNIRDEISDKLSDRHSVFFTEYSLSAQIAKIIEGGEFDEYSINSKELLIDDIKTGLHRYKTVLNIFEAALWLMAAMIVIMPATKPRAYYFLVSLFALLSFVHFYVVFIVLFFIFFSPPLRLPFKISPVEIKQS